LAPNKVKGFVAEEVDGRMMSWSGLRYVVAETRERHALAREREEMAPILRLG